MFSYAKQLLLVAMTVGFLFPGLTVDAAPKWRAAYYANQHSDPNSESYLPLEEIPWQKYTHVIQSAIIPTADNLVPGINTTGYNNIGGKAQKFVTLAHDRGVKALVSLIVTGSQATAMENNTNSANINGFVSLLTAFVTTNNYDGIDIDWEGYTSRDIYNIRFPELIRLLRLAMPSKIITIAGEIHFRSVYATLYSDGSRVYDKVDQINLMSYDMDGTYGSDPTPSTWFNSAVRMGPMTFDYSYIDSVTGVRIYGSNHKTQEESLLYMLSANIPAAKLGLGVPFYGYIVQGPLNSTDGVTLPQQVYAATGPTPESRTQISYHKLVTPTLAPYWDSGVRAWNDTYKAPYISYNVDDPKQDAYVTYTDPRQITESVKLLNEKGLGGMMTFALGHEYLVNKTGDDRYPLSMAMGADLAVTITASPNPVIVNDAVTYTVTVTNAGPSQATGVRVTVLAGCTLPTTTLDTGMTASCSSPVNASIAGTLNQTVAVSGDGYDSDTANNTATVTVTVNPSTKPLISGFWPGAGPAGTFVFVFGKNFIPAQTTVTVNGIYVPLVQVINDALLIFILPSGNTTGPIAVTTPNGSATNSSQFGAPLSGLQVTGLWPGESKIGGFVFVFGNNFVLGQTTVKVNGLQAPLVQVQNDSLLIFIVSPGMTTGPVTISTPAGGSVSSSTALTITP